VILPLQIANKKQLKIDNFIIFVEVKSGTVGWS